ncbi:hypothetical protein NQ318_003136 [Aromia moschata]|uniref:PiggyBac transposable element-derived protein domain-containing protein n=1 Tax=Aromia moschata TaxID=1265417 RepID=A0AAV8YVB2_9CUCU|nr:hypothetical protein NQ318_003136 [Aromia moschata]
MYAFISILLLSGYLPVPRRRMFWEQRKDTQNILVADALSRDRFEFIMQNLHCCDNDQLDPSDKFTKVRPLFDKLNKIFQEYSPYWEQHSVDESIIPYFRKHGYKQFIRENPIRYGYKIWMGATSTGYGSNRTRGKSKLSSLRSDQESKTTHQQGPDNNNSSKKGLYI